MCHAEVPEGQVTPNVDRQDIAISIGENVDMPATLFSVDSGGPGIVLNTDIHGPSPFYICLASRLAVAGFSVLLPDFFFRQGPAAGPDLESAFARRKSLDEAQTVRDLDAATTWLKDKIGGDRVGSLGFCMGGTYSLDLASLRDDLVTVSYYGFPEPQATLVMPPPRPLDLVDDLSGPVLAFWGEDDHGIGVEVPVRYATRAEKVNSEFSYEIVAGVGHAFLGHSQLDDPEDTGAKTWKRTIEHFQRHLV
ncbi:dienelactone hydrolase family protein [Rhodococcus sp. KBS0724]|jgi:carboxymethylenebutenolidase|uniref:dienelactone hydrolase family protein n=1 Tax=Rhodococcus sp. KBS0724 TaxID=1179674 RepID=UPI00110E0E53|nr:dienelactone hydrolase family protein [Rhodococcus sp. KBS0724]TSD49920.1 dienelactone hydrolase family protein [Rhodococcus sp. KBS0724]